jgi:hypothetical protein
VAGVHTAERGIFVDLEDLGLKEAMENSVGGVKSLVGQLASYQDLMAEVRALSFFSPFLPHRSSTD